MQDDSSISLVFRKSSSWLPGTFGNNEMDSSSEICSQPSILGSLSLQMKFFCISAEWRIPWSNLLLNGYKFCRVFLHFLLFLPVNITCSYSFNKWKSLSWAKTWQYFQSKKNNLARGNLHASKKMLFLYEKWDYSSSFFLLSFHKISLE